MVWKILYYGNLQDTNSSRRDSISKKNYIEPSHSSKDSTFAWGVVQQSLNSESGQHGGMVISK